MAVNPDLVCIIDDDPMFVFGIKRMLERKFQVGNIVVFSNGQEALDYFAELAGSAQVQSIPGIILLDINMPILDGWGFLDGFAKLEPQLGKGIKMYLVTSSIDRPDIEKAKKTPRVLEYIVKPVKEDKIREILSK